MNFMTIVLIALGLSMDAFAVSVAGGAAIKQQRLRNAFKFGIFFGLFQVIMPILGWFLGLRLKDFVINIDHWIAFGLLVVIGVKMIYESFALEENHGLVSYGFKLMLLLSVATSIDALAVGLSFAFLNISFVAPVVIIGIVTFSLSFIGVFLGNAIGHFFEKKIEIFGGLILIGIGVKILLEHILR